MRFNQNDLAKRTQERVIDSLKKVSSNRIADSYFKVAQPELKDMAEQQVVAGLLNNFQKIYDSAEAQSFIKQSNYGPYVMEVWPLVTAWYPDFPLKDLISVQDMDKPLAYMFFSLLKTGTTKSDTFVGESVETPLGIRTIRGKYPTGEVVGEVVTKGQIDSTDGTLVAYAPLNVNTIPGYLEKTKVIIPTGETNAGTYQAYTVTNGFILFKTTSGTEVTQANLTIEVSTGIVSGAYITGLASANSDDPAFSINYVWNLDFATVENIQKVVEDIEMRPMEAVPRALMMEWTLFSEYLKKSQFGQDIREDNTKRILNLLYQYQVRYILDDMYDGALGNPDPATMQPGDTATISLSLNSAYSLEVQNAAIMKNVKQIGQRIELASGRMEGNRIVAGYNLKSYLESLPNNLFQPTSNDASAFSGPREIGKWGIYTVYYDPMRAADEGFMTYRGENWYDACYYLGEFMPIVPTDAIALAVTVRSSFVSMEAYRFDKPTCVMKLQFTA